MLLRKKKKKKKKEKEKDNDEKYIFYRIRNNYFIINNSKFNYL